MSNEGPISVMIEGRQVSWTYRELAEYMVGKEGPALLPDDPMSRVEFAVQTVEGILRQRLGSLRDELNAAHVKLSASQANVDKYKSLSHRRQNEIKELQRKVSRDERTIIGDRDSNILRLKSQLEACREQSKKAGKAADNALAACKKHFENCFKEEVRKINNEKADLLLEIAKQGRTIRSLRSRLGASQRKGKPREQFRPELVPCVKQSIETFLL